MALVAVIVAGVAVAGTLALRAFNENVMFYFDPTKVAAGEVKTGQHFRLGGMVQPGSVQRMAGTLQVNFIVTDFNHTVPVKYDKVLPDLFKEGSGVVAHGKLDGNGTFVADEVLAKHDEKYMPPEVSRSLKAGQAAAEGKAVAPVAGQAREPIAPPTGGGTN
jgi:cytochrome c-type biogenesis protein CcmE